MDNIDSEDIIIKLTLDDFIELQNIIKRHQNNRDRARQKRREKSGLDINGGTIRSTIPKLEILKAPSMSIDRFINIDSKSLSVK